MRSFAIAVICLWLPATVSVQAAARLSIHEWGTFTALQDEDGHAVGGINADDEPLPPFVHDLIRAHEHAIRPDDKGGIPICFPSVTMRLETPVLYFHPPSGSNAGPIDVNVEFHGGLLSQFYPQAVASIPTFTGNQLDPITSQTTGTLAWKNLTISGNHPGPVTDSHVWNAPRTAASADVQTTDGESEQFLFYRGVGHLNAPIRVVRTDGQLMIYGQIEYATKHHSATIQGHIYYCEFQADGRCAWRSLASVDLENQDKSLPASATLRDSDFSSTRLPSLKSSMHQDLVEAGLFEDEATAMLDTWELSYFKSPGTRIFFIVPAEWTEHYLPLSVSTDAEIHRVMMGRIDLITPEQRSALRKMSTLNAKKPAELEELISMYQSLGRFRSSLLLDEQRRRPSPTLEALVRIFSLQA